MLLFCSRRGLEENISSDVRRNVSLCDKSCAMFMCQPKVQHEPSSRLNLMLTCSPVHFSLSLHINVSAGVSTLPLDVLLGWRFLLIKTRPTKYGDRQIPALTLGEYHHIFLALQIFFKSPRCAAPIIFKNPCCLLQSDREGKNCQFQMHLEWIENLEKFATLEIYWPDMQDSTSLYSL